MKKIAILQSNYIPWKGYFDLIAKVDEFILYDDMQYTRRDWRNRNKIKTPNGLVWLTVPVEVKGKYLQKINETVISDPNWAKDHWVRIKQNYGKSKFFKNYKEIFENCYLNSHENYLSIVNYNLIKLINEILGIHTKISWSSDYHLADGKTERLLSLVEQSKGTEYISGPSAKDYIVEELFTNAGIKLTWMDYSNYPEYEQLYGDFAHNVSILDLLFNEGENAKHFMKYLK